MNPKQTYRVPEYLNRQSDTGQIMSDLELKEIESILDITAGFKYPETDVNKHWKTFSNSITSPLTVTKRPTRFAMFRWAAAAIVILTIGIGFWQYQSGQKLENFTAVYQTTDQKETVQLPDGSVITLNKGTSLDVVAINGVNRVLKLNGGEIFLNVAHNTSPFSVITNKGIITVMGTEFAVKSVANVPFSLYLKTGKIVFETSDDQVVLKAGELLLEDQNGDFVLSHVSDNRSYAWISGKLIFDNTSLIEVIKGLESNYQVKFDYDTALSAEKLTITFEDLSAEQAAELLAKTINSSVSITK